MTEKERSKRFVPIRRKLLLATVVSGLLAVVIAIAGLYCMHLLNQRLNEVVGVATEKVKLTHLLRQDLSTVMRSERNMLLVTDAKEYDRLATEMDTKLSSIDGHVAKLHQVFVDEENRTQLDNFVERLSAWKTNHQAVRQYSGLDAQRQARELSLNQGEMSFNGFERAINAMSNSMIIDNQATSENNSESGEETPSTDVEENDAGSDQPRDGTGAGDDRQLKQKLLADLRRDALKLQRVEKNLVLQAALANVEAPEQAIAPFQEQVQARLIELKNVLNDDEKQRFSEVERQLNEYLKVNEQIVNVVQLKGNVFGFQLVRDTGLPLAREVEQIADSMLIQSERSLGQYERESNNLFHTFRNTLLVLSLLAVAASVFVSLWIGDRVANNVKQLSGYAADVHRAKDLTLPVPKVSNDEIGELAEAFENMRVTLLSQNSQLEGLNDTLEHKNEEMEQFVYSVSHDLKSPLVSCKGLVGLINEDIEDGDFEEVVNSAERLSTVTDQMSDTIDDLLTFSRLGRNPLDMTTINIVELVDDLQEDWQQRLDDESIDMNVDSELHPIYADPISLRRVFDNLIGNAVKYAGDTEDPTIEIGSEKHGRKIRYFVRDNGPGIAPEYHDKIFRLFQRLDTTKKGTGIGLASAAKIVRQHRGKIWVESTPGNGATFWVELPNTNPKAT